MTALAEKSQTTPATTATMENPEPYTRAEFAELARAYPDLRMELTKEK